MRNQAAAFAKFQKFRQNLFNRSCICNHRIINTCQFGNPQRNRSLWIDEHTIMVCYFPITYLHRTNFDNRIVQWTKTGSLQVKYYIIIKKRLSFIVRNKLF